MVDLILNYLYDVYERNVDIQVRFKWTPHASGKRSLSLFDLLDRKVRISLMEIRSALGQPYHPTYRLVGL